MSIYLEADYLPATPTPLPLNYDHTAWSLVLQNSAGTFSALVEQPEVTTTSRLDPAAMRRVRDGFFSVCVAMDHHAARALEIALEAGAYGTLLMGETEVAVGAMELVRWENGTARLRFRIDLPGRGVLLCRDAATFLELSKQLWLPQVFGTAAFHPPVLFDAERNRLSNDLPAASTVLHLEQPVDWPAQGRVQVEDEVLEYRGIASGGRQLTSLLRPAPRPHRRHAEVLRVSLGEPTWCLADHPAEAVELRAGDETGPLLSLTTTEEDFFGRTALLYRRTGLPLIVNHGRNSVPRETERDRRFWQLRPETTALDPFDAFTTRPPQRGAVLTGLQQILTADFSEPVYTGPDRFNRIVSAALRLEFTDTPYWGPATRLRVTIMKGERTVQYDANRSGVLFPVSFEAKAAYPKRTTPLPNTRTERIGFEHVTPSGPWDDATFAIDGLLQGEARVTTTKAAALRAKFVSERPERMRSLRSLKVCASFVNHGASSVKSRVGVAIPGKLHRTKEQTLAAGESSVVTLSLALSPSLSASDVFHQTTTFSAEVPMGGDVGISEMWMEPEFTDPVREAVADALATLPVTVEANLAVLYNQVNIDVTAMMLEEEGWDFFSANGGPLRVRLELINPPSVDLWAVYLRNVHWSQVVFPATSVRATDRIWARVSGRTTSNPADVVEDLLSAPEFAASDDVNAASITAAHEECVRRGLSYSAVFMKHLNVAEALASALGECGHAVIRKSHEWQLVPVPADPELVQVPEFPTAALLEGTGAREVNPTSAEFLGADPQWSDAESGFVRSMREARRRPELSGYELALSPALMTLQPGTTLHVGDPLHPGDLLQGEVAEVLYRAGRVTARMEQVRRIITNVEHASYRLCRSCKRGSLLIFVAGRLVAELTDAGLLRVRGTVRERAVDADEGPLLHHVGDDGLYVNFAGASICFAANGEFLTSVLIAENAPTDEAAPTVAVELREAGVALGGAPPGIAALFFDESSVRTSGRIVSHFPFPG